MEQTRLEHDPYLHDEQRWGVSLAHMAELMLPCLDAAGARSVVEVGAFAGDLTRVLVDWAAARGARIGAVDPMPQPALEALERERPELDLVRATSLDALPRIALPDAVVLDGDHNYFTVSEELRLIAERAPGAELPLILLHDVSWPHARRDDYYDPAQIPDQARHPLAHDAGGGIYPGESGIVVGGGLPYPKSAAHEGGPRNGVLTAVEDFVEAHDGLRLAVVPAFFGFGAVWHAQAPWADDVATLLEPWDRNPILTRLEANRVEHVARGHTRLVEIWALQERLRRQEAVLGRLLDSSAIGVAERLSRVRARAGLGADAAVVSKDEIRRALEP
jgi:hypothetical protein